MGICNSVVRPIVFLMTTLCLSGCWTVRETEHPVIPVGSVPPDRGLKVQVAGFDAEFTFYDTAYTYGSATGFNGGWWDGFGRYYVGGPGTAIYSSTTYVPHREATSAFRDRASDKLERAGCILQAKDPEYRVEVRFDGPFSEDGDTWATVGWLICTVFTADFGAQDWIADLRIHDLKTGKLVHEKRLSERDEAVVWGLIPVFSPSCATRTAFSELKSNCLFALTDKAVAETISFLSGTAVQTADESVGK